MSDLANAVRGPARLGTVFGIATVILGVLAIFAPAIPGIAVTVMVAVLMIAAGIARTIYAFKAETFGKGALTFLFGGVQILCGVVMLARPMLGLASITLVLVAYFVIDGITVIWVAFQLKPQKGWGWMAWGGFVSFVLAFMIGWEWPVSGTWAIGVLLGVHLIYGGWSMIALGGIGEAVSDTVEASAGA